MGQSDLGNVTAEGLRARGTIEPGAGLHDAIRQSRVEQRRFHAYLAYRVARAESVNRQNTATAA